MTKYFDVINGCLGWGDPAPGGLWFVGLEEAGASKESEVVALQQRLNGRSHEQVGPGQLRKNYDECCANGNRYTATNIIMSKIAINSGFEKEYTDPREYWFGKLFQAGSRVFQSNLYPLGKKSWQGGFPEHYRELFGFDNSRESRERYEELVSETRWAELGKLWEACRPCATVCFGKVGWNDFRKVFKLDGSDCRLGDEMEIYEKQRVILTPFFVSHQMSDQRIGHLSEVLKNMI